MRSWQTTSSLLLALFALLALSAVLPALAATGGGGGQRPASCPPGRAVGNPDRKSTRLNSSH